MTLDGEPVPNVRRILQIKLFHPDNDHYGMSPIEAASTAIDIHNAASKWNKALLDNSARPSGALVYSARDGNLTPEQYDRLKNDLDQNFQSAANAGRPMLLEGGLDWKPLSLSPKDMDFLEAKHSAAREIALAIGVPPMLLGIPGDNTFSNYQEANRTFWRQTVIPLAQRAATALSMWLSPAYGGTLSFRPDIDTLEALSSERDALWTRINTATFLTNDEKRAAAGYGANGESDTAQKYSADQPRNPSGQSDGGQWAGGGNGGQRVAQSKPPTGPRNPQPPSTVPKSDVIKTPGGRPFTSHGHDQATIRGFSDVSIDAIADNNAKSRIGKVDGLGAKTWEYTDSRGNTVVTNESGGIVTVFSPASGGAYIPKP